MLPPRWHSALGGGIRGPGLHARDDREVIIRRFLIGVAFVAAHAVGAVVIWQDERLLLFAFVLRRAPLLNDDFRGLLLA